MATLQKPWKLIKRIFLNKYLLVLTVFGVFFTFFDEHNLISRWNTSRKVAALEQEVSTYKQKIENDKKILSELMLSDENIEKYAREKYLMKQDNEDIFIIKE